jgi:hypothetical protein
MKKLAEVAAIIGLFATLDERTQGRLKKNLLVAPEAWAVLKDADLETYVPADMSDVFTRKRAKTDTKITGMMESYIGDEWDNDFEVLEWCGFLLGAGIVHAALVEGLGAGMDFLERMTAIRGCFTELLSVTSTRLTALGRPE